MKPSSCAEISNSMHGMVREVPYGAVIVMRNRCQYSIVKRFARLLIRHQRKAGNNPQGHQQSSNQGIAHHIRHGRKQLLLDTLKGEQRQVRRNNDESGKEDRTGHLDG